MIDALTNVAACLVLFAVAGILFLVLGVVARLFYLASKGKL